MRSLLMVPLLVAGCFGYGGYIPVPSEPQEPIEDTGSYGADSDQVRYVLDNFRTSELGTEKTRPIAKTVEWPEISTLPGASYVSGKAVVDRIQRGDSGNSYGVQVRLKNTTGEVQSLEYRIRFVTRKGSDLIPYVGIMIASRSAWRESASSPAGSGSPGDRACRPFTRGTPRCSPRAARSTSSPGSSATSTGGT